MSLPFPCLQITKQSPLFCPVDSLPDRLESLRLGGRKPRNESWSASLFQVACLPSAVQGRGCTFTDFLWVTACFLLLSVCGFQFQKRHIMSSSPGLVPLLAPHGPEAQGWLLPVGQLPSHLPGLPLAHLSTHCPWGAAPEALAGFISLCLNPNQTGTHFLLSPS